MKRSYAPVALVLLAACTAGGIPTSSGGGGGTVIAINLTLSVPVKTPYGESGGYKPAITNVPVGSSISFTNTDSFPHTATSILGATQFPPGHKFGNQALTQSGTTLSGGFTTGALQAGTSSQSILVDTAGTYLFGCFFHYGAPMRAAIVAQ